MNKKTVLVDFDGVLNNYEGKYDENILPDIKNGAANFIETLSLKYTVKIFTTRDKNKVASWLEKHEINKYIDDITNIKEPAWLIIDDRCINFNGNYKKTLEQIENFKVWYK